MRIVGTLPTNRRRNKRVRNSPVRIELEGRTYETLDWSLGGFLIAGYKGLRLPGDKVTVGICVTANGCDHHHVARAEIVRIAAATGYMAATFTGLDARTVDTLEGWMTGRLRRQPRRRAG